MTRAGKFHRPFIGRSHSLRTVGSFAPPDQYIICVVVIQNLLRPQSDSGQVGKSLVFSHHESLLTAHERSSRIIPSRCGNQHYSDHVFPLKLCIGPADNRDRITGKGKRLLLALRPILPSEFNVSHPPRTADDSWPGGLPDQLHVAGVGSRGRCVFGKRLFVLLAVLPVKWRGRR